MPFRPFVVPFLFASLAIAQGMMETVIPGRDFVQHKLLSPGLTDTWKLTVEGDEMLWCTVDAETFDPVLSLVNGDGELLGSNDGPNTHSELWIRVPAKGAYEFRVSPFRGSGGGHYTYRLHRFGTSPLAAADGETTHTFGREQWWHYRVALKKNDVLVPTVLGDGRLTAVLDADRNPLTSWRGCYRAPRDGDYFVRVEGHEGKRCQTLTQLARLGERPLGACLAERTAPYGLDVWRVRLPASACLQIDVRMPEAALGVDLLEVPQPNLPAALVDNGHFDKGGMLRRLYFARREVTLEVALRNGTGAAVPYEFTTRRWGQDARVGEAMAGTLPLGDGALYHLPLTAGEMVEVGVDSEQFDAKFDLHDPEGNKVAFGVDDRSPVDRNAFHRFLVTRPGTWHVLVHCCGQASGAFTLRSASQPLPRLLPGQGLAVQPGAHVHLDLTNGDVVWLSLRSGTFDGALQLVDPTGDAGFVAESGGLGGDVLVAYCARHAGRHTLIVHARSGRGDGELTVVRPALTER
ncbi:MAG TPA: hypothetical protein VFD82_15580 [Planctomycetota bacterium]|nr:hypothetical protein [Planctomycetota bacterium]